MGDSEPSLLRSGAKRRRAISDNRQANFFRGERGPPGLDGLPGLDGAPGLDGVPGADGRNGKDGVNGRDGKDGRDGQPGERGPPGPVGPPGEPGRAGKQGPSGRRGSPGPAGVCAYQARFNCDQLRAGGANKNGSSGAPAETNLQALLVAPTMVGQPATNQEEERQVSVNEGDNIQLSCAAFGLPKPVYVWRRSSPATSLVLDVGANLRTNSYTGGQLPLTSVDRLQSGGYECTASNGVPPIAIKRINLDVNYPPTVRLYPAPSKHRAALGSSLLIECLTEANPSSFSYWMFGASSIMSMAPFNQVDSYPSSPNKLAHKKYVITESTGQLSTGASYTLLTLNITSVGRDDLGVYKCVSKNLVGQSVGFVWLDSFGLDVNRFAEGYDPDRKFRDAIEKAPNERLERSLGWPSYLVERDLNYSTFGNELRLQRLKSSQLDGGSRRAGPFSLTELSLSREPTQSPELISTEPDGATQPARDEEQSRIKSSSLAEVGGRYPANETSEPSSIGPNLASVEGNNQPELGANSTAAQSQVPTDIVALGESDEQTDLCRVEGGSMSANRSGFVQYDGDSLNAGKRSATQLLDQVGKPVYVGCVAGNWLSWWSFDTKLNSPSDNEGYQVDRRCYATSANLADQLYSYENLTYLLNDQMQPSSGRDTNEKQQFEQKRISIRLSLPMSGNSHLIYGGLFIYLNMYSSEPSRPKSANFDERLQVVALDLSSNDLSTLRLDSPLFEDQPLDLGPDYKLNRAELVSDENGIWLLLPTIETRGRWPGRGGSHHPTVRTLEDGFRPSEKRMLTSRRLHVIKLQTSKRANKTIISVDYHVSMKLDWRMIGQMFVIDGVLYGIKDRHLYTSKLQFAYDIYKCKLLPTEYLSEPHRTFTNHFGNTQMISYNPNEPKRLYTIDNGNLLWCPVKLIKTNLDVLNNSNQNS